MFKPSSSAHPLPFSDSWKWTPSVVTLVRADRLEYHLKQSSSYDPSISDYLVDGFQNGFKLGHKTEVQDILAKNKKIRSAVWDGSFTKSNSRDYHWVHNRAFWSRTFYPFQVSPLGVKPKKTPGKYRLIHEISYPYDDTSIKVNIPSTKRQLNVLVWVTPSENCFVYLGEPIQNNAT